MDVKNRLADLLLALNISQGKFAKSINISPSNVSEWISKDNKNPSMDALFKICFKYNVNINWLLTGKGEMFISDIAKPEPLEADQAITSIPIYTDIAAGAPYPATYGEPLEVIQLPTKLLTHSGPYLAFKVNGQSMEPLIMHDDYVVLTQNWKGLKLSGRICAFRTSDGITLKTMHYDKKSRCTFLFPVNQKFSYTVYDKTDPDLVLFAVLLVSIRKYI